MNTNKASIHLTVLLAILTGLLTGCSIPGFSPAGLSQQSVRETHFSDEYVEAHEGKVFVEVPEVFELAHVAWAIAKSDQEIDNQTVRESDYYQRVLDHFLPHKGHELIQILAEGDPFVDYYGFRTNSASYEFDGDHIRHAGIYPNVTQPDVFTRNLSLVEDFAKQSGFRTFYRENLPYYTAQIQKYDELVPIAEMWAWLEENFPNKYGTYKVLFSPLIKASHNTQSFHDNWLAETVMYVAGPDLYETRGYDPEVERGLLARVVFTEIDHNYVNRVTDGYKEDVERAFEDVEIWNAGLENRAYYSPVGTFNEYMTWGVFLLYAHETYSPAAVEEIAAYTINLMENLRGFSRFGAFSETLREQYKARDEGQLIPDLYPVVLEWAATQE